MSLKFRDAADGDRHFISAAWIDSYRTAHAAGMIAMHRWRQVMTVEIADILLRKGVRSIVAYHPDIAPPADLYGFIVIERGVRMPTRVRDGKWRTEVRADDRPLVHYVFVKQPYRLSGIALALFREAGVNPAERFLYSCKTSAVTKLASKIPSAEWNPLIARYPKG